MGARGLSRGAIVHNCDCATHQRFSIPLEISTIPGTVKGEDFQGGGEKVDAVFESVRCGPVVERNHGSCGLRSGAAWIEPVFHVQRQHWHRPDPRKTAEALVQVYAAWAYGWRGIFAVHTWIALKPRNANRYAVLQVMGWWPYPEAHPLRASPVLRPDRRWHGAAPEIVYALRGDSAQAAIPKIREAAKRYPHNYKVWPGPNSNTSRPTSSAGCPRSRLSCRPPPSGRTSWWTAGSRRSPPAETAFSCR